MITNIDEAIKLMRYFDNSYINANGELIISEKGNVYICLDHKTDRFEFVCAILEWCSRDVVKGSPYVSEYHNKKWREKLRLGFNAYIGKDFSITDWETIYQNIGNGINYRKTNFFCFEWM